MFQKIENQLYFLLFLSALFLASALSLIFFVDPFNASKFTILIFYVSIFFFSLNFFALILYFLRSKFAKGLFTQKISTSLRQGFLIALFITASLLLAQMGMTRWWIELTLIIMLSLIEGFFLI